MRNKAFESEWLSLAAQTAGFEETSEFAAALTRRLKKGADEYGDNRWTQRPFLEILREAQEEHEDAPAWLVLAAQRIFRDPTIPKEEAEHIVRILVEAAAKSLEGWHIVGLAMEAYEEAQIAARGQELPVVPSPPVDCVPQTH